MNLLLVAPKEETDLLPSLPSRPVRRKRSCCRASLRFLTWSSELSGRGAGQDGYPYFMSEKSKDSEGMCRGSPGYWVWTGTQDPRPGVFLSQDLLLPGGERPAHPQSSLGSQSPLSRLVAETRPPQTASQKSRVWLAPALKLSPCLEPLLK